MGSLQHIAFDFIRYANCWEDADVLIKGLKARAGSRILSICSGGDNSLSLLTTDPAELIAVDVSEVQLYLMELKMLAIEKMKREEYLAFAGFTHTKDRLKVYNRIKLNLSDSARSFWDQHEKIIEKGIIYGGKFDKYLRFFALFILPLIHSRKTVRKLLATKSAQEQLDFYTSKWDNMRWRALFNIFFSKQVMGKFGRDPELMKHVQGSVAAHLYKKTGDHFCSTKAQNNFILHYILIGKFGQELPHYVRKENYEIIRSRLDRIRLIKGYAEEAAAQFPGIDAFNLSNIFEYLDEPTFSQLSTELAKYGNKQATYAYWNLMVPRNLATVNTQFVRNQQLSEQLSQEDCGFFYGGFCVDNKRENG